MPFLSAHTALIQLGILFEYTANTEGVCHGVTLKWAEAFLLDRINHQPSPGDEEIKHLTRLRTIQEQSNNLTSLYNDIMALREKIKKGAILTPEEQALSDIPAFYEQLCLYHTPYNYSALFGATYNQAHISATSLLAGSTASLQVGGWAQLNTEVRAFSRLELLDYFNTMASIFEQQSAVIVLSSSEHTTALGYHAVNNTWTYYDINRFPPKVSNNLQTIVQAMLSANSTVVLSTITITLGLTEAVNKRLTDALKKSSEDYLKTLDASISQAADTTTGATLTDPLKLI